MKVLLAAVQRTIACTSSSLLGCTIKPGFGVPRSLQRAELSAKEGESRVSMRASLERTARRASTALAVQTDMVVRGSGERIGQGERLCDV